MLSPEALEEAGEALARVYRGIEADMLDYLVDLMLSGAGVTSRSVTAAALLGQTHADELPASSSATPARWTPSCAPPSRSS